MGALATHCDDVRGRGGPDAPRAVRKYLVRRFGRVKARGRPLANVGMEASQANDFSVKLTQWNATDAPKCMSTASELWATRRRSFSLEEVRLCRCKLGELCRLSRVSRSDLRARLAPRASRVNSLQGSGIYRTNDLAGTTEEFREGAVSKNISISFPSEAMPRDAVAKVRPRGCSCEVRCGAISWVGWSDAGAGGRTNWGRRRLGYVIACAASTLRGPSHITQLFPKSTRKLVKSSLGGKVYARREMLDHGSLSLEFFAPFVDFSPGISGRGDC